jgi:hypothetical protein
VVVDVDVVGVCMVSSSERNTTSASTTAAISLDHRVNLYFLLTFDENDVLLSPFRAVNDFFQGAIQPALLLTHHWQT